MMWFLNRFSILTLTHSSSLEIPLSPSKVAESIPSAILQSFAFLRSKKKSIGALLSIIVSACTTGLASATISYDFDTDPAKRRHNPNFYGYSPDDGGSRFLVFLLLFLNSTTHILGRTLAAALLASVNVNYLWSHFAADMGLYLLFKFIRGDFIYWMPLQGAIAIIASFLCRVFAKIIVDYTGCVHFRHPYELGGFYWTFNLFLSQLTVLGSTALYISATQSADSSLQNDTLMSAAVDPYQLWTIVGCIGALWFFSFTAFIFSIKSEYVYTFFTTTRGKTLASFLFLKATTDAARLQVFTRHASYWLPIKEEVRVWVKSNWYCWEEEQPEWWTEAVKSRIPDDIIPAPALQEEERKGGGKRRSSSLRELVGMGSDGSAYIVPDFE